MDGKNSFPALLNLLVSSSSLMVHFKIEYCNTGKTLHRLKANRLCCEKQNNNA